MFKNIVELFRIIKSDIVSPTFKFGLICSVVNCFPGFAGAYLRTIAISRYLGAIGKESRFLGYATIIHPEKLNIGKKVLLSKDLYIQASGWVEIGDYTIMGPSVKIWSLNHIFTEPEIWIPEQGYEFKPVRIGKHVWIGANVFIMPGAEISDGCIVSAGAIIGAKKYPPYSILAGNPARKIGQRPGPKTRKEG